MPGDRRVLLANSMYHLTNDGAVAALAGQIIVLQAVFGGFGPAEVGLLGGTTLVVTAIFQIVFGIMSDRRDPSRFLPIGIVILGFGSLAASLSWNFWSLLFLVALSRIGASFYHPVGISWIGREFEGPALDRSMGFQSAFGDAGVILGIASSAILAVAFGWQWPFLLWGGINVAAVAVGLSLSRGRPSPPHLASRSISDYVGVLRDVRRWLLPLALVGAVFNIVAFFGPLLLNSKFGLPANVAGVAVALWILAAISGPRGILRGAGCRDTRLRDHRERVDGPGRHVDGGLRALPHLPRTLLVRFRIESSSPARCRVRSGVWLPARGRCDRGLSRRCPRERVRLGCSHSDVDPVPVRGVSRRRWFHRPSCGTPPPRECPQSGSVANSTPVTVENRPPSPVDCDPVLAERVASCTRLGNVTRSAGSP